MERLSKDVLFLNKEAQCACKNKLVFVCWIVVAPFITLQ